MSAAAKNLFRLVLGFPVSGYSYISPSSLGTNTYLTAVGFVPSQAATLNEVSLYLNVTGTLAATDITITIYDDSGTSGGPGTSLGSTNTRVGGGAPVAGWNRWNGLSISLAANTRYWAIATNSNGSPSANYISVWGQTLGSPSYMLYRWSSAYSANGGSTWNFNYQQSTIRLGYSDGSYEGQVIHGGGVPIVKGSTGEVGTQWTLPSNNVSYNVRGLKTTIGQAGSGGTGNAVLSLYTGASPVLLDSVTLPVADINPIMEAIGIFSTVHTLSPGTVVTMTVKDSNSSDTVGFYYTNAIWDADSNSLPLSPIYEFSPKQAAFSGGSWSYTSNQMVSFALLLDPAGEFTASGGGSGGGVSRARVVNGA